VNKPSGAHSFSTVLPWNAAFEPFRIRSLLLVRRFFFSKDVHF
jgi:hypothetical protein